MHNVLLDPAHRRVLLTILIVVLLGGGLWWQRSRTAPAADSAMLGLGAQSASSAEGLAFLPPQATSTPSPLGVDVVGAVERPGVYFLQPGARVQDAVAAAGGLAPDADRDAVNMSAHVVDAVQIRIPHVGQRVLSPTAAATNVPAGASTAQCTDINTADTEALATLPGIGPALAKRIVDHRATHGPFRAVDELQQVSGVGPAAIGQLKDLVCVGDQ